MNRERLICPYCKVKKETVLMDIENEGYFCPNCKLNTDSETIRKFSSFKSFDIRLHFTIPNLAELIQLPYKNRLKEIRKSVSSFHMTTKKTLIGVDSNLKFEPENELPEEVYWHMVRFNLQKKHIGIISQINNTNQWSILNNENDIVLQNPTVCWYEVWLKGTRVEENGDNYQQVVNCIYLIYANSEEEAYDIAEEAFIPDFGLDIRFRLFYEIIERVMTLDRSDLNALTCNTNIILTKKEYNSEPANFKFKRTDYLALHKKYTLSHLNT